MVSSRATIIATEFCMNVNPKDIVLIYADKQNEIVAKIAQEIANAAIDLTEDPDRVLLFIKPTSPPLNGEKRIPHKDVHDALVKPPGGKYPTKIFLITSPESGVSYTTTISVKPAMQHKACFASMPMLLHRSFTEPLDLAPMQMRDMKTRADKLYEILKKSRCMHITTPAGTDYFTTIDVKSVTKDLGEIYKAKNKMGNLPGGEVFFVPFEFSEHNNGTLVVDAMLPRWEAKEPMKFTVCKGRIIRKESDAPKLYWDDVKCDDDLVIGEIGIGINPKAKVVETMLESEKAFETCHFAVGNNKELQGRIIGGTHRDRLLLKPTITVYRNIKKGMQRKNGTVLLENGKFKV
ncbi:MAG: hypothetical protein ABIG20_03620 [archaeon]